MAKQILKCFTIMLALGVFTTQSFYIPSLAFAQENVQEEDVPADTDSSLDEPTEPVLNEEAAADLGSSEQAATTTEDIATSTPEITATSTELIASSTLDEQINEDDEDIDQASTTEEVVIDDVSPEVIAEEKGTPAITSGESVALANILNLVNTNFINANGVILFSNFFDFVKNTLDLRSTSSSLFDGACLPDGEAAALSLCSGNQSSINISNDAYINNSIFMSALTGGNYIDGGATSTIDTGDAFAGLNLINIANTNFVDSNYLLVTLNAFRGVDGDIVFPSLSNFFNSLAGGASPSSIEITNTGEVSNNVETTSETGGNTIEAENSDIKTGDSNSSSNIFNQINTNLVGGANVSILFRVYGDWVGEVFGVPENLGWTEGPEGSIYLFDTASSSASLEPSSGSANIEGSNDVLIKNDVSVIALTGDNKITGSGTGLISTGNAHAGVNLVNIANSNIIGRNWIMAIINIFGDFNGNIAFGRPDLWVGEQIGASSDISEGSILNYKFSVINNGDSPATKVKLVDNYSSDHIEIINSSVPYEKDGEGNLVWNLGNLPAGMATEINYSARVTTDIETEITNVVSVSGRETDNNITDNTDTATVHTRAKAIIREGSHRRFPSLGASGQVLGATTEKITLFIERSMPLVILKDRSQLVHQELVVRNPSEMDAKAVKLSDVLKDPNGNVIHQEEWDFGDMLPKEEITVSYDLEFKEEAESGFYNLSTKIQGANTNLINMDTNGLIYLTSLPSSLGTDIYTNLTVSTSSAKSSLEKDATTTPVVLGELVGMSEIPEAAVPAEEKPINNSRSYFPIAIALSMVPVVLAKLFQTIKGLIG